MLINVVHDLDLLRHLCGEVAEIQAMHELLARAASRSRTRCH